MDIWKWLITLTLSPISEGRLCMCTYSRRPWSNVAKDIRVHYMYIDVIKWSIQVHCQSKDKAVNQTQSGFTCYRYKFWFLHKNSHVWHVRVLCNYHYSMGTLLFVCFLKYLLYFFIYLFTYVCIYSINNIQSI